MVSDDTLIHHIDDAISRIGLDLEGQVVLTEAASGLFLATSILALRANARQVYAVAKDSRWGSLSEIRANTRRLAKLIGREHSIHIDEEIQVDRLSEVNVVTNLGFVRPIDYKIIQNLPKDASIALMWEPWEFRPEDIDMDVCVKSGIPVIGTNEHHPNLVTFKYVGMLALKLLLETGNEVLGHHIVVIGSNPFGEECAETMRALGAQVTCIDPLHEWQPDALSTVLGDVSAIVIAEHRYRDELIGSAGGIPLANRLRCDAPIVHICGKVDYEYLERNGFRKYPESRVPVGHMTVTTAYLGPKPVINLHCAGLHVASLVARELTRGASIPASIRIAVASGYALPMTQFSDQDL